MSIDQSYLAEPEVRVTNESTGGQKGAKLTQVGALDPVSVIALARVAGMGANKYSAYNFMKGTDWSLMFNAMQRHALRFWSGEDIDPESGEPHMAHAAWMALALVGFALRGTGVDDRPPTIVRQGEVTGITVTREEQEDTLGRWLHDMPSYYATASVENRGDWPPDTRVNGYLTCCGQTEHAIDCPQWR